MTLFFSSFFYLLFSVQILADDVKQKAIHDCLEKKELAACTAAVPLLNSDKQYAVSFKAGEILCDLNPDSCYSNYFTAKKLENKKAEDFLKSITEKCSQNADFCDSLAVIQEELKQYPESIESAKKYFNKNKKGSYIRLVHSYGNKDESYAASLADCKNNNDSCTFYLRYFYEHPQKEELVKGAEKNCQETSGKSQGASNCAIVGTYHFKNRDYDKAYKFWSEDCKNNPVSCALILGSKRYSNNEQEILKKFCEPNSSPFDIVNLRLTDCAKITEDSPGPTPAIDAYTKNLLTQFLNEQK